MASNGAAATTDGAAAPVAAGAEESSAARAVVPVAMPTLLDRSLRAVAADDVAAAPLAALLATAVDGSPLPSLEAELWTPLARPLLDRVRRRLLAEAHHDDDAEAYREAHRWLVAIERVHDHLLGDPLYRAVDALAGRDGAQLLVEVAHDMRSPLGAMLLLLDRVRSGGSGAVNEAQVRQLGLVYGAAFGLAQLAGDLMELGRGSRALAGGPPAPVMLADVLRGVRDIVQPVAEEKGLTLAVYGPADHGPRLGLGAALSRVLLNLATNACKYTDEGRVEIALTAGADDQVECVVADTGRGLPEAVRRFLDGRGDLPPSAGLGLAICRKLVAAMGGTLQVSSSAEAGTRIAFTLALPLVRPVAASGGGGAEDIFVTAPLVRTALDCEQR